MRIEEFEDLVDRLGEDISQWPDQFRKAGEALLSTSAEARAIVAEARRLRAAFSRTDSMQPPPDLADRIVLQARAVDRAAPRSAPSAVGWGFAPLNARLQLLLRPSILLPLCFAVGLMLGLYPLQSSGEGASQIEPPAFFQACCGGNWGLRRDD
jgi:hypothetical protein